MDPPKVCESASLGTQQASSGLEQHFTCSALQQEEAGARKMVRPVRCSLGRRKHSSTADRLRDDPCRSLQPSRKADSRFSQPAAWMQVQQVAASSATDQTFSLHNNQPQVIPLLYYQPRGRWAATYQNLGSVWGCFACRLEVCHACASQRNDTWN